MTTTGHRDTLRVLLLRCQDADLLRSGGQERLLWHPGRRRDSDIRQLRLP